MALLAEYALTPDVFDSTAYRSEDVGDLHLQVIKEVLLSEGLVRDLRNGEWRSLLKSDIRPWHRRGKELLKKLIIQKRLVPFPKMLSNSPSSDEDWCNEALASHESRSLAGIIISDCIVGKVPSVDLVSCVSRLTGATWWLGRSPSMRLRRTLAEYQSALALVLGHANSIMFIDPHLDPSQGRYLDFITLLGGAAGRAPTPLIEIHRVCYHGSGASRQIISSAEWEQTFRQVLSTPLQQFGLSAEIFIWDDFHDRHIISDLVGISALNGFDTSRAVNNMTTWSRLGRADRDDIQREFDPASNRHQLKIRFRIPR